LNQKVAATFSKTMDATTIQTSTFSLMQGTTPVSGFVTYTGMTANFSPASNLLPNTVYTATIATGAKDLAGNALANNYVWSFTTGAAVVVTPPTVNSTDPLAAATGVPFTQKVTATFSKTMDASTITTATFTLMQGTTPVAGFVFYSGTTATFSPAANLSPNTVYTATITTGAKDLAGNALANNYVWSFTTVVPYTVTLSSIPVAGGTTSGSGTFNAGSSVTVVATPNTGYTFTNWKEGATAVSANASYTFTISANRILVANFTLIQDTVKLLSSPALGGNVYGAGAYNPGSVVTVNTTSKPGYQFTNWTVNGAIVSTNASYTLTVNRDTSLVANFTAGQLAVVLGTSARFAILSNSAITNISTSSIAGDVGISPGSRSSIAGLTIPEVTGTIYAADDAVPVPAMLIAAKTDAENAYLDAVNSVRGTPTSISGNLNGLTLVPGLYESGSSIQISPAGFLYLDAKGDSNAVFVIRSATSITTESTSEVVLAGNARAKNIFWSAGSAVTLGTNSKMKGTIIASTSISLLTGARLDGRALIQSASAGQVSLDQSTIVLP